jgi:pyruvate ferredoxin oxidoreductase alpha subunit
MDDAEYAIIATGSAAGTIRTEVEKLRSKGIPVGMIKLRSFRPFPAAQLANLLSGLKAVAVFDRSSTFAGNTGGPIFIELRSSLYEMEKKPQIINFVYGLGGRDLSIELITKAADELLEIKQNGFAQPYVNYLGLRE